MTEPKIDFKKKRIRRFFLALQPYSELKEDLTKTIESEGLKYIQLKLDVNKITPEFIDKIKEKVNKNILSAKIRIASFEDLKSVLMIHNRAWLTSNEPFRPIDFESLKKIFQYPNTIMFIANVYGTDAGFILLDFEDKEKKIGIIAGLGVIPRFQRKGLGTILSTRAWNYFQEKEVIQLKCEVFENNKISLGFIKSLGFKEFDTKTYTKDDFIIDS
ncbi:MAG: GNAT family N-acetyltransferase [Candidatus Lokiarchaeota archaeon]|nr:GNAT family N-acetyltransferase [Candidatus Lokiarchaeota archaeon]